MHRTLLDDERRKTKKKKPRGRGGIDKQIKKKKILFLVGEEKQTLRLLWKDDSGRVLPLLVPPLSL